MAAVVAVVAVVAPALPAAKTPTKSLAQSVLGASTTSVATPRSRTESILRTSAPARSMPMAITSRPTPRLRRERVTITDQLQNNLDWSTSAFVEMGFGDNIISIPANSTYYSGSVSMKFNGQTFNVELESGINLATGIVFATFQSIDPLTSLPPDVLTGFLPPEDGTGRGKGHFLYTVQPKAGLPTGSEIRNVALVSFDGQTLIATNQVNDLDPSAGTDPTKEALNTIDAALDSSAVSTLPAVTTTSNFTVNWSGQDDSSGSGIASYDIYSSDNGGNYTLWKQGTTDTEATFTGTSGHTYRFYSVAYDNAGNIET